MSKVLGVGACVDVGSSTIQRSLWGLGISSCYHWITREIFQAFSFLNFFPPVETRSYCIAQAHFKHTGLSNPPASASSLHVPPHLAWSILKTRVWWLSISNMLMTNNERATLQCFPSIIRYLNPFESKIYLKPPCLKKKKKKFFSKRIKYKKCEGK